MISRFEIHKKWRLSYYFMFALINMFWVWLLIYINIFPTFSSWFMFIKKNPNSYEPHFKEYRHFKIRAEEARDLLDYNHGIFKLFFDTTIHNVYIMRKFTSQILRRFSSLRYVLHPWCKDKILIIVKDLINAIKTDDSTELAKVKYDFMMLCAPFKVEAERIGDLFDMSFTKLEKACSLELLLKLLVRKNPTEQYDWKDRVVAPLDRRPNDSLSIKAVIGIHKASRYNIDILTFILRVYKEEVGWAVDILLGNIFNNVYLYLQDEELLNIIEKILEHYK